MIVPTSAKVGYRRDLLRGPEALAVSGPIFLILLLLVLLPARPLVSAAPPETPGRWNRHLLRIRAHRTLLTRARRLLDGNDSLGGLRLLQSVLDSNVDSFVLHEQQYTSARRLALDLIRHHPAAGAPRYVKFFQPKASALLRRGTQSADSASLRETVRRYFLTPAGFQALDRLATTWLDHGDASTAARAFLKLIDEPSHRNRLTPAIRRKASVALALAGQPKRAASLWPGRPPLSLSATSATDWTLPLGSPRNHAIRSGSPSLLEAAWQVKTITGTRAGDVTAWFESRWADPRAPAATSFFPVVHGQQVIVRTQSGIKGLSLKNGTTLWHYTTPSDSQRRHEFFRRLLPVVNGGRGHRTALTSTGNPRFGMLTSDRHRVYAVELSPGDKTRWPPRLVALSLPPTSTAPAPVALDRPDWVFPTSPGPIVLGPPLPIAGQLVLITEHQRQIELVGLSPETGRLEWRQPLVAPDAELTQPQGANRHTMACLPASHRGLLVCPTGLGLVVAVDVIDGTLQWLHDSSPVSPPKNPRRLRPFGRGPVPPTRGDPGLPNLPMIVGKRLLLLPPTSPQLACLDLESGTVLWTRPRNDIDYVATASDSTLLVIGRGNIRGLSLTTGDEQWQRRLGIVSGRGARLDGDRYLVPLKSGRITCLEIDTGREAGISLPSSAAGPRGAAVPLGLVAHSHQRPGNLIVAGRWILSLNAGHLTAFPQAAQQLLDVQRELAASPDSDLVRLHAAELNLALGRYGRASEYLTGLVESTASPVHDRARGVMRELLYVQLARAPAEAGQVLDRLERLERLSDSPRQTARLQIERTRWHLRQKNASLALAAITRLGQLNLKTPQAADRDGIRIISRDAWLAEASRQALALAVRENAPAGDRRLVRQLNDDALRLSRQGSTTARLDFISHYPHFEATQHVRLAAASDLVRSGHYQQAELLLLQIRQRAPAVLQLQATTALVQLWDRFGLWEESAQLLEDLHTGHLASVVDSTGRTGRQFVSQLSPSSMALTTWKRHRHTVSPVESVTLQVNDSIAATHPVSDAYQRHRRRFSTSERTTLDLLETYTGQTRRVTLVDRRVGVSIGHVDLPTHFSIPFHWHQANSGHLLALGGPASVFSVSLLEHSTKRPFWSHPYGPLVKNPELLRVGPASPSFCCFQSRSHLFVVNPLDGVLRWRRSDLESGSGLFADAASGLFGDDEVLVVCAADRVRHEVFRTSTGERVRSSRPALSARTRRRVFGRFLMFIGTRPAQTRRMQVWDPATDRNVLDEPLHSEASPTETSDFELAWLTADGRLRVHDPTTGTRRLDVKLLTDPRQGVGGLKVFRDRDNWYVALLPSRAARVQLGRQVFFVGDTLLPVSHISGELVAIDAAEGHIRWRRSMPLRSVLRFRNLQLPFLVMLGRVRDRARSGRQRMLLELLDMRSGRTLLLRDNLPTDRIVQAWFDPGKGQVELAGLKSRIELTFPVSR